MAIYSDPIKPRIKHATIWKPIFLDNCCRSEDMRIKKIIAGKTNKTCPEPLCIRHENIANIN